MLGLRHPARSYWLDTLIVPLGSRADGNWVASLCHSLNVLVYQKRNAQGGLHPGAVAVTSVL